MSVLFNGASPEKPPKEVMAEVLLDGRKLIGRGEDDWNTADTCRVIELLPEPYKSEFTGFDPVIFKNWMQRLRKDKVVPKVKPTKNFVEKVEKWVRDFEKQRERLGDDHLSEDYKSYIQSDEWRRKSREHKERCNWKCQLCNASTPLETHHTAEGYRNLGIEEPWHLIAVCKRCHPIADALRSGWFEKHGGENASYTLFDEG